MIGTLNAFIKKHLGLTVMTNRVFRENNLPTVREKQAASWVNGLKPFFNFRPIDFTHVDRQLISGHFKTSKDV